jgi:hypothetical protein
MYKKSYLLLFLIFSFFIFGATSIHAQGTPTLDDTISLETATNIPANSAVTVDVILKTNRNVTALTVPVMFKSESGDTLNIDCDSIHWSDWVMGTPPYLYTDWSVPYVDSVEKTIIVYAMWLGGDNYLAPDSGTIFTVYFTTHEYWGESVAVLDTYSVELPFKELLLMDDLLQGWIPVYEPGYIRPPTWVKEVDVGNSDLPEKFALNQNYPNPFNPTTVIRFALPEDSWVRVEVFNILGQKITTLVDEYLTAGYKETGWDGTDSKGTAVASGIYFYKINARNFTDIKKMVLLK